MEIKLLIILFLSAFIPQVIKLSLEKYKAKKDKKIEFSLFKSLAETGGMPSSHASMITAVATGIYLIEGISILFVVTLALAFIVIRDATGVRYAVGEQAQTLNRLIDSKLIKFKTPKKVRVVKGHTVPQVLVGIVIGFIVAIIVFKFF
ncbi:divergent PAP2 family protein [Candidatus Woesearchaeota archaeon]|nr:divergent PAP2 family protein [Candidatus Woesearchaeota archaeon]